LQSEYPNLHAKFTYDGKSRLVRNITIDDNGIIGMEVRKAGKFSNKIKRYSHDKIVIPIDIWKED
jgi:hypothetical protein